MRLFGKKKNEKSISNTFNSCYSNINVMYLYISEMKTKQTLGQYLKKRLKGCRVTGVHGEWLYVKEPLADELDFYIQQFKAKDSSGHSEW